MICCLVLGYYGERQDTFLFDCNYDQKTIRAAYEKSIELTGLAFDGRYRYEDERAVFCSGNTCNGMSIYAFDTLRALGVFDNLFSEEELDLMRTDQDAKFNGGKFLYMEYLDEPDDVATILMNFIALSMPADFEYAIVTPENLINPDLELCTELSYR